MLVKINENNELIYYRGYIRTDGKIISNPPARLIEENGFKPLVDDGVPEGADISDFTVRYHEESDCIKTIYTPKKEAE